MWELDYKGSWAPKNWCFWTVVLDKTLESPLDCKEIQPVHPKGNQSWIFIGRTDAEAEIPVLWPPDAKSWLIWKDPDAGKDWDHEEKGTTENKMVGWHHRLNGHKFEQGPGVGDGQESLACCSPWGRKELDTTERLNWITSYPLGWLLFKSKHKTMENNKYQILARMWKNWNFCALLVGIYNDATTVEYTLRVPHKIKDRFAIWSSSSHSYMFTRKNRKKARIQTDTCTSVFIVALFTKTRRWAQSKCSSTDEWVNKMWWMLAMTYYSAVERNEIVTIFYNMGEAWRHYAKWNKPGARGQIWNTVYLHLSQVPKSQVHGERT